MDLFARAAVKDWRGQPLAERMRPRTLAEFVGQAHILGPGKLLRRALEARELPSLILWGPPGTGKTTLGRLLAAEARARFVPLSAVMAGVKDLREAVAEAATHRDQHGERTVLFIDEIHRFNKAQQDALLPHVEAGTVVLVGATTENPSFEVNAALLSRAKVVVLRALAEEDLRAVSIAPSPIRSAASAGGRWTSPTTCATSSRARPAGTRAGPCRRWRPPPRWPSPTPPARSGDHGGGDRGGRPAEDAALRQGGRRALRRGQRLHQEHARAAIPTPRSTGWRA